MSTKHCRSYQGWIVTGALILGGIAIGNPAVADGPYMMTNLGIPDGADSVVGVRMNNLGHVAGWSVYYGQGEPSLKGWVWTPRDGFTILPPPPGFFLGRSRAMDVNDDGVVAGDGGYDIGLAWRYENGEYTVTGGVENMPGAYVGGINDAGDIAGTAKDGTITTPDHAFLDVNGGDLISLTPSGGRATDVNNNGQVCGYVLPLAGPFEAFRWDEMDGVQLLGRLDLAFSSAWRMNDAGDVVGEAKSATGNTRRAWIYTDADGMQELPAPYRNSSAAVSINNRGDVVGITEQGGLDINWLWTGGDSTTNIATLFDAVGANVNVIAVHDINNAGQILVQVFDNTVPDFRMVILTPPNNVGDVDGDGDVDMADHAMFTDCMTGPGGIGAPECIRADVDGDSDVDLKDHSLIGVRM